MNQNKLLSSKIAYPMFSLMGIFFLFSCLTEHDLASAGNIHWTGAYTFRVIAISLTGGILIGIILCRVFAKYAERQFQKPEKAAVIKPMGRKKQLIFFAASLALITLAWLPSWLAYYPGICSYDSYIQVEQIVSGEYIDHHPIAHTLLIRAAMWLGENLFGSVNAGIGLYSLIQLISLSAVFAYGIMLLRNSGAVPGCLFLIQLLCMFYPFHLYMSVTVTKDVYFTVFFLLLLFNLLEFLTHDVYPVRTALSFLLSTAAMILFRKNGSYAFAVLLFVLLLTIIIRKKQRQYWKRIFLFALAGFIIGILSLNFLFDVTGASPEDKREMLSMPIQQLARTMIYHGGAGVLAEDDNTMGEAEKSLINDFILSEAYKDYDAHISDPVKRHTNTYVVRYRAKDFISAYLKLLSKYPGDFLNAVLEINSGYLYPWDVSHAHINVNEQLKGMGYIQTCWTEYSLTENGIYKDSKWDTLHKRMEEWADENAYLTLPLLKYLFMPGIWLWLYLLLFGYLALRKKFRLCLPLILVFGYYATLFLGPTVQLRYLYPIMCAFPFLALLCLIKSRPCPPAINTDIH